MRSPTIPVASRSVRALVGLALFALPLLPLGLPTPLHAQQPPNAAAAEQVKARYRKVEARIRMRDGVHLFTSIYVPRDTTRAYPFLMSRTPYGVGPYGADAYRASLGPAVEYLNEGFIFVYQDVRGRNYSEGEFSEMTPHLDRKRGAKDVDESTDTWDTIAWLLKNVRPNIAKVGIVGGSYPGFYTSASCIDAHPALVACSPQAPITDLAKGDDLFHNGAFLLPHNFGFYLGFGAGERTAPGPDQRIPFEAPTQDGYKFFLELGSLANIDKQVYQGRSRLWKNIVEHPSYDEYWKARDLAPHMKGIKPAMLVVGGWYDAEDLHGPLATYRAIDTQGATGPRTLVMGPWSHGQWNRGDADFLGHARFGTKTGPFFRDSVQFPFFMHHLKGAPAPQLPKALMFETGSNQWKRYDAWPPSGARDRALYFQPGGKLAFDPPAAPTDTAQARASEFEEYVSDPAKPVPFIDWIAQGMPREYMTADQRFASRRPDVLVYQTEPLTEDITIAGPLAPVLHVATTGTDADFVVKLIDVFPDSAKNDPADPGFTVAGYQQLVRGEPFRGRYRRSFSMPVPFTPSVADSIRFSMPDVNHTFRKGHRIMVQIQSSWFPFVDRNPQTFVPNIFEAAEGDFRKATMRVYQSPERPTRIGVKVLDPYRP